MFVNGAYIFPLRVIVMSSANSWVFIGGLRLMVMSLIPIKNSVMLTDPSRTPFFYYNRMRQRSICFDLD